MIKLLLALSLAAGFENPPDAAKSRVWWHWMNGNVSKAGITADLEAMAAAGIGGAHIFDVGCNVPPGPVKFNTPAWDEHIRFAAAEAERLGLELTLVNCSGYANAGGPWVAPSNSMFFVTWTETELKGGARLSAPLPRSAVPDNGFYRDIAVLAFPKPACEAAPADLRVTGPKDGRSVFSAAEPFTLRGITFRLALSIWAWNRWLDLTVETSDDGVTWREACRCGDLVVSGGRPDCTEEPKTLFFPEPVTARHVRLTAGFSRGLKEKTPGADFAELRPSFKCGLDSLTALTSRLRAERIPAPRTARRGDEAVEPSSIVDVTGRLRADGTLDWTAPEGRDWIVLRVGYRSNGVKTGPCSEFGGGYEVDKLDAAAVARHFDAYAGRFADLPVVKAVLCDSWEVGPQNWTHGFERQFERRCGYSLVPYLVAFSGRLVGSAERTGEVLRDFRRAVSDTFAEAFMGTMARKCREHGLAWASECYGNAPADNLSWSSRADIPMTEFWVSDDPLAPATDRRLPHELCTKVAASDAHVLGKRFVDAEGFTAHPDRGGRWLMDPFGLKTFGDVMYCAGVNRMVYHRFAHQPWTDPVRLPGMTMGQWGTHFERTETWWPMVGPFLRYQARCQHLLQEGRFAGDLLCFAGDEVPNSGVPETDIRGGFDWDACARELLPRLKVRDGRLVAPSGADYAALVLPTNRLIASDSRREIERLRRAGARVVTAADDLALEPDFTCADAALHVRFLHRRYADGTDGYFVAYPGTNAVSADCSFRIKGRFPQVWDAESGARYRARNWRTEGDRTRVTLDFKPCGSWFVMFAEREDASLPLEPSARTADERTVNGPWTLSFPEGWRCPKSVTLETLKSWTDISEGEVKYFSGIATYEKRIDCGGLGAAGGRVWLDLGRVRNLAEVTVNGRTYPALWRPPFRVDVTDALKAGQPLDVRIRVANLWPNRLIGDAQLPEDCEWNDDNSLKAIPDWVKAGEASPSGRLTFTTWRHWKKDAQPLESGLLGPVRVMSGGTPDEQGNAIGVVRRVFREARLTRGNTNIAKVQPIDDAAWIWLKGEDAAQPTFLKFRNEFEVNEGDGKLVIDVSADERYYLTCDGVFVSRGPNRSTVENWQYNTYEIDLKPGRHVFEATVWKTGDQGPLAQLSWRGGFILKANAAYDKRLTTGVAKWQVGKLSGIRPAGADNGVWGTGSQWEITGSGIIASEPSAWSDAEVVRGFAGRKGPSIYGGRTNGWMLFPSQLPDQTEDAVRPGRIVAVTQDAPWRGRHVYTEAEARETIDFSKTVTIPAKTKMQLCWDLGRYICAYPVLKMKGAKGARVAWDWAEASKRATDNLKGGEPGARDAIVGRYLEGYGDTFVCDGKGEGTFTTPWFRCGKWCRLSIETGDEPLEITDIHLVESRYPLEMESAFVTKDDATLPDIRRISARAMQMCCHEMLFDCPYYEQQMYPGDTRVQLNVISAMTRDERMIKRAIELYDLGTRDDGQCPFNWPTRGTQEGATYTLCYLLMFGDYVMNHADRAWLRARVPGLRKAMAGMELYENADGLLENMPGWQFMDWVVGWRSDGTAPGGRFGEGVNAEANLLWSLAMRSAALTERALGNELQARYWEAKRERLNAKIVETFWCEARGIFADTPEMKDFSEHAQCLALVGDVLPEERAKTCFGHLIADPDLRRTTVYFNFYLFEAYFKFGRGDLFLKRLDLWRDYVKKGLTTTQEAPDSGKNGQTESRSDCHAWGAHPIWFMQTGLAGIRSDAPFFDKVLVAPSPGALTEIQAKHPHPRGFVEVDLKFANDTASGTVKTPVPGTFVFGNQRRPLVVGENRISALGGGSGTSRDRPQK